MAGPAYLSDPYVQYLSRLLDELAMGEILVPAFQRRLVWDDDKRLELLRSIRDGIPIGSILVWRTKLQNLRPAEQLGPHELPAPSQTTGTVRTYLLDGLQRLSTLYGALRPLPNAKSPFIDDDGETRSWLFTYDLLEEEFRIEEKDKLPETRLPLTILLDSARLLRFGRELSKRADADLLIARMDAVAETFRNYKLPVIPIVGDDLADATRTFQRINSQGTEMSELHMVRALTWSPDYDLEDEFTRAYTHLERVGWSDLDPEVLLEVAKASVGLDIWKGAPDSLSSRLRKFPSAIRDAGVTVARAVKFLREWCDILSPRMMTYSAQIVLLAEAHRIQPSPDETVRNRLVRWFWLTTYAGLFAGISGGQLKRQLDYVRTLAIHESAAWPGPNQLRPELGVPRRFDPRSVRVKATCILLAKLKPLDLDGTPIPALDLLAARGAGTMQPIVPLEFAGPLGHSFANRLFCAPGELVLFLKTLVEQPLSIPDSILSSHAISHKAAQALSAGDYHDFLLLRHGRIAQLQRDFLTHLPGDVPEYP
jgi:hypothetical protein